MEGAIYFDGKVLPAGTPVITADSRGLRYGDGLFETIKVIGGEIQLLALHMERLFRGLALMQFDVPVHCTPAFIAEQVLSLCRKNKVEKAARVRLAVFRGNGGLYDPQDLHPHILIQTWALPDNYTRLNENGLVTDVYQEARKSCDRLANLKSNNYLPYVMAALHAKKHQLNDCLLLNTHNRICDSTIANIFMVTNGLIITPPLSEGCVAGVMRQHLLAELAAGDYEITEAPLTTDLLHTADEVFFTNALYGIRWVQRLGDTVFSNALAAKLYNQFIRR